MWILHMKVNSNDGANYSAVFQVFSTAIKYAIFKSINNTLNNTSQI